jgi:surface protein
VYKRQLTLPQAGIYGVSISKGSGTIHYIRFDNLSDKLKLLEINQWGNHPWTTMAGAFWNCSNLTISAIDRPNLSLVSDMSRMFLGCNKIELILDMENWNVSNVKDMSSMFYEATTFNQSINQWDVSNVTNMSHMFFKAYKFDQPLDAWDVSNVTNMSYMFTEATSFNQSINQWNVSNVTNMSHMFSGTTSFNQPLDAWDVSNVTDMSFMLANAFKFDQPLNAWDVSNVTSMSNMFRGASSFDQPLDAWNVSNVTNMSVMFSGATFFNQSISQWNVSNVTNMSYMLASASKFDQPLNAWNVSKVTDMSYMFYRASKFNQPLSEWDVSKVTNMSYMFNGAYNFDQPLNDWNVSKVTNMSYMFSTASNFNHPLNKWDLSKVTHMRNMLDASGIDCANITYTLQGWAANPQTPNNITLGADEVNYAPEAVDALNTLRNDKNWTITIGSEVNCEALPVTLVYFKAAVKEQLVEINWATTLEENHDFFEVQRSHDAVHWTALSQVTGQGTTFSTQNYTTTDPSPLKGTSYYRLKMVDTDGSFEYSTIRSVELNIPQSNGFIYPNPAQHIVTFQGLPQGTVRIYNALGQLVKQAFISPEKASISINELPAGTYTVQALHGYSSTLIKMP